MKKLIDLFAKAYGWLICSGKLLQHPILLVMRLYWGWSLIQSGLGKFKHIQDVISFFGNDLHIPFPQFNAYFTAGMECVGGALLLTGLASRLISIPLIILLLVAFITGDPEKWKVLFSDPDTFMSATPFPFLVVVILVLAFGPGVFSLDWIVGRIYRKKKLTDQCAG